MNILWFRIEVKVWGYMVVYGHGRSERGENILNS